MEKGNNENENDNDKGYRMVHSANCPVRKKRNLPSSPEKWYIGGFGRSFFKSNAAFGFVLPSFHSTLNLLLC